MVFIPFGDHSGSFPPFMVFEKKQPFSTSSICSAFYSFNQRVLWPYIKTGSPDEIFLVDRGFISPSFGPEHLFLSEDRYV